MGCPRRVLLKVAGARLSAATTPARPDDGVMAGVPGHGLASASLEARGPDSAGLAVRQVHRMNRPVFVRFRASARRPWIARYSPADHQRAGGRKFRRADRRRVRAAAAARRGLGAALRHAVADTQQCWSANGDFQRAAPPQTGNARGFRPRAKGSCRLIPQDVSSRCRVSGPPSRRFNRCSEIWFELPFGGGSSGRQFVQTRGGSAGRSGPRSLR